MSLKTIKHLYSIFFSISILALTNGQSITYAGLNASLFPNGNSSGESDEYLTTERLMVEVPVDPTFSDSENTGEFQCPECPSPIDGYHWVKYKNTGEFQCSPGCPSPIEDYHWVKYKNNPTKCYLAKFVGPCPNFGPSAGYDISGHYCNDDEVFSKLRNRCVKSFKVDGKIG